MKKVLAIILYVSLLSALTTGCSRDNNETPDNTTTPTTTTIPLQPEPPAYGLDEVKNYLHENFDNFKIDGSTSMFPLHESLVKLFSSDEDKLNGFLYHSRTVDAFNMFTDGERDILLGVDYSAELLQRAKNDGVELGQKAITREGFVFLINRNNPVQSLTEEQIRGIYSGEITNWKELGGDDADIHAFQRNSDSGSQMRMVMFMGDTPLTDAEPEYIEGAMGGIIEKIADYDYGKYSIAYNMYTFTEKQYSNSEVIMLAVNGVSPTDETIFDDSYPIVIYNYIYYNENNTAAAKFAENLHIFLMSDEGQKLISDSGYVNLHKAYDRKLIDLPWYEGMGGEWWIDFYNRDKGEFYIPDGQGNLLVFDNYADYVLYYSRHTDHAGAREFITTLYNSDLKMNMYSTRFSDWAGSTPRISYDRFTSFVWEPANAFTYIYDDKYYSDLYYDLNEEKIILSAIEERFFEAEYLQSYKGFEEYIKDVEPGLVIELTINDLKDLQVLKDTEWWRPAPPYILEYFKPFK